MKNTEVKTGNTGTTREGWSTYALAANGGMWRRASSNPEPVQDGDVLLEFEHMKHLLDYDKAVLKSVTLIEPGAKLPEQNKNVYVVRPDQSVVLPKFLYYTIQTVKFTVGQLRTLITK